VHQNVQKDHPVDNILGDIEKRVTTISRVINFREHYSFVSSFEPFKVQDALRDLDWVVAMQEKLNNFKRNEVWSLVERPNQNIVGIKWVFHSKQDGHILGLTNIVFEKDRPCSACQARKQVKTHHHAKNITSTTRSLEMLHMNLFGPVAYITIGGNKYSLVIIYDYSRFTSVFFLQDKS
jgi:hypothetical protein